MNTLPGNYQQLCDDYTLIEKAIYYLEENFQRQPELNEIATSVGLSEYHFQRVFTRWAGVSPKRFVQFLTRENAKDLLKKNSVLDAAASLGLSSPGRLHDLFISTEAVTPGEYKRSGAGLTIRHGCHPTPFGLVLIGLTERGICHLAFIQDSHESALQDLSAAWPNASLLNDDQATAELVEQIFSPLQNSAPISLHVTGTNFQIKVWEALLKIPAGGLSTYETIAGQIGQPHAARAVGSAVGRNTIAYLIPCHRVIRKIGEFGNYRWGSARKKALHGWETALASAGELPSAAD